jgi:hypothetical protein
MPRNPGRNNTDEDQPDKSNDPIGMPNIKKLVKEETERLTKELIDSMKGILVLDVNYDTINFIPEDEIDIPRQSNFIRNQFTDIVNEIRSRLAVGYNFAGLPNSDYPKYLKMFNFIYNSRGDAEITLSLDYDGLGADDLKIHTASPKQKT